MTSSMSQETPNKLQRLHGLDFCRAVFMILGLFYHAALIYSVDYVWRVKDSDTSSFLTYFSSFIHAFRMEAFYLISGFFYLLVYTKRADGFLNERLTRVIPPLLVCGLLINPVMNYFSYEREFSWDSLSYFIDGQWLGHLWFLGNLIVYFIVTQPFCKKLAEIKPLSKPIFFAIFCFIVPFCSLVLLVFSKFTFTGSFIFISFDLLFGYFPYFIFGAICFQCREVFIGLLTYKVAFLCCFAYFIVVGLLYLEILSFLSENLVKAVSKLAVGMLVLSMISFVYNFGKAGAPIIRVVSDASYTIYLLHQPLIILIYYFVFLQSSLNIYLEYLLIVLLTFVISFVWHIAFVKKSTSLGFLFNGVKPR